MKAWDIIGYAYAADIYCNGVCVLAAMREVTTAQLIDASSVLDVTVSFETAVTVDEALDVIAKRRGINRRNADTNHFPAVIFASEEFPDYCPTCSLCHGVLDGFDADDYKTNTGV